MITVSDLRKHYRVHKRAAGLWPALRAVVRRPTETVEALRGLSFEIAAGERVGFLGPNGAGKTTTLKILSGLLHPTAGVAQVAGFTPQRRQREFLRSITLVMGQKQQLLWDLPALETFAMNRAVYDLPRAEAEATQRTLIDLLQVGDLVRKPVRQLSLGERMKCELVAALLHSPKVLFLDEPTIGLDVAMQVRLREFIADYNRSFGATVILTSHYMQDVAALCPRVIIIDAGRLRYDGALDALVRRQRPERRITFRLSAPPVAPPRPPTGTTLVHDGPDRLVLDAPPEQVSDTVRWALEQFAVTDLTTTDPPLEDVMRALFDQGGDQAAPERGA